MTRKYKKLRLKLLPPDIRAEIVRLYVEENVLQNDIAKRFRISSSLVSRLVK